MWPRPLKVKLVKVAISGKWQNYGIGQDQLCQRSLDVSLSSLEVFIISGCADKVRCFCCGLGLYKWRQGSNPWVQHALHMPSCPHVLSKGQNFIEEAAEAQVSSL